MAWYTLTRSWTPDILQDSTICSGARPICSARRADRIAEAMMARYMICCGSNGSASLALSSIIRVSSSWSRLPQLTPMRTGLPWRAATSTI
jgi:hypothetical protein